MPSLPTITIDTNSLHRNDHEHDFEAQLVKRLRGKTVLLPDTVIAEIFSSSDWTFTSILKLSRLAPFADNLWPGESLSRMMAVEKATGQPCPYQVDAWKLVEQVRARVRLCASDPEQAIQLTSAAIPVATEEMQKRRARAFRDREKLDRVVAITRATFGDDKLAAAADDPTLIPAMIRSQNMDYQNYVAFQVIQSERGIGVINPGKMAQMDCAFNRFHLMLFIYPIYVFRRKPLAEIDNEQKILGMHSDREIAAVASYTDEFYTKDELLAKVANAHRICVKALYPQPPYSVATVEGL